MLTLGWSSQVGAVLTGLSAAAGARDVARSVGLRLALAAASGIFVGGYIALEFFPGQGPLQVAGHNRTIMRIMRTLTPYPVFGIEENIKHAHFATPCDLVPASGLALSEFSQDVRLRRCTRRQSEEVGLVDPESWPGVPDQGYTTTLP